VDLVNRARETWSRTGWVRKACTTHSHQGRPQKIGSPEQYSSVLACSVFETFLSECKMQTVRFLYHKSMLFPMTTCVSKIQTRNGRLRWPLLWWWSTETTILSMSHLGNIDISLLRIQKTKIHTSKNSCAGALTRTFYSRWRLWSSSWSTNLLGCPRLGPDSTATNADGIKNSHWSLIKRKLPHKVVFFLTSNNYTYSRSSYGNALVLTRHFYLNRQRGEGETDSDWARVPASQFLQASLFHNCSMFRLDDDNGIVNWILSTTATAMPGEKGSFQVVLVLILLFGSPAVSEWLWSVSIGSHWWTWTVPRFF